MTGFCNSFHNCNFLINAIFTCMCMCHFGLVYTQFLSLALICVIICGNNVPHKNRSNECRFPWPLRITSGQRLRENYYKCYGNKHPSNYVEVVSFYAKVTIKRWRLLCLRGGTVKFIYTEKATKFFKIFTLLLSYVLPVKSKVTWRFCKILWPSQNI